MSCRARRPAKQVFSFKSDRRSNRRGFADEEPWPINIEALNRVAETFRGWWSTIGRNQNKRTMPDAEWLATNAFLGECDSIMKVLDYHLGKAQWHSSDGVV
jgi:hypothetical protein